jgi:hypothetical protein
MQVFGKKMTQCILLVDKALVYWASTNPDAGILERE